MTAPTSLDLWDVLRTIRLVTIDITSEALRMATENESTASTAGLLRTRSAFSRMLRRLDVDLEILHAERVPSAGGLIFIVPDALLYEMQFGTPPEHSEFGPLEI